MAMPPGYVARGKYVTEISEQRTKEEQQLQAEYQEKVPVFQIAATHGRTVRAIEGRLERLGLLPADQRSTASSFPTPTTKDRRKKE